MLKIFIVLLNITSIFALRRIIDTTACNFSSSFQKYFYTGLISEYKSNELKKTHELIELINNNINDLVNEFNGAVDGSYNNRIIQIGYFTTSIEIYFDRTIKRINYDVDSDDADVRNIVSLIRQNNYKKVAEEMKKVNDEIMVYKIIEESYKAELTKNPYKLLRMLSSILQNGLITDAVAILLGILKEFTKNPENMYTIEMLYTGELIFETTYRFKKYYQYHYGYDDLDTKIRLLRVSLPKNVEQVTFGKFMKFCITNKRFGESMFLDGAHYNDEKNKRLVYTWNDGVPIESKLFNFIYNSTNEGYIIENNLFEENLYTGTTQFYDRNSRYVFSQWHLNETKSQFWELTPYDKKYFLIRNLHDLDYLFSHQDNDFADEFRKRRVFTWKGRLNDLPEDSYLWAFEDCV